MSLEEKRAQAKKLMAISRLSEAKALFEEICKEERTDADSWFSLGLVNGALNQLPHAIQCFKNVLMLAPESADAYFNLGKAYLVSGYSKEAVACYRKALEFKPDWTPLMIELGNILLRRGELTEGLKCLKKALEAEPENIDALFGVAFALQRLERFEEAATAYSVVLSKQLIHAKALQELTQVLLTLQRYDEVIDWCHKVQAEQPESPVAYTIESRVLLIKGEWQQAYAVLEPLIKQYPHSSAVALAFLALCQRTGQEAEAVAMAHRVLSSGSEKDPIVIADLNYEIARILDRQANYEEAFKFAVAANNAIPGPKFDAPGHDAAVIQPSIATFSSDYFASAKRASIATDSLIFIVGMPRSGTSLLEQILDSHSEVAGAGELSLVNMLAQQVYAMTGGKEPYPHCVKNLTGAQCDELAQQYLDSVASLSKNARYVADKMPQNFIHLGLINTLFPQAKIIQCVRDPRDIGLSCFFQNFRHEQSYSRNLVSLGQYFQQYQQLMTHWENTIDSAMAKIFYEELVTQPEETLQSLCEFLDLAWEPECLRFYENPRIVATASNEQVREALHSASAYRWKHYEHHLSPLVNALVQ